MGIGEETHEAPDDGGWIHDDGANSAHVQNTPAIRRDGSQPTDAGQSWTIRAEGFSSTPSRLGRPEMTFFMI